jgi:hypothetical protein
MISGVSIRVPRPFGRKGRLAALVAALWLGVGAGCSRSGGGGGSAMRLTINEVMANANPQGVDPDDSSFEAVLLGTDGKPEMDPASLTGEAVDWIEVYNPLRVPVSLADYTLTDDRDRPDRFRFPAGLILDPGEFVLVICDNRPELGGLHAPFRLQPDGERVYLFGSGGRILIDQMAYGALPANVGVGRFPDGRSGAEGVGTIHAATPGAANRPAAVPLPRLESLIAAAAAGELIVRITVLDDDFEGQGILSAEATVTAIESCAASDPAAVPSPPLALTVDPARTETFSETRKDPLDRTYQATVTRFHLEGRLAAESIPDFDPQGLASFRVRIENAIGTAIARRCVPMGAQQAALVINEYQPRPVTTLPLIEVEGGEIVDETRSPDWFEIYNPSDQDLALDGYSIVGFGALTEILAGVQKPACPPPQPAPPGGGDGGEEEEEDCYRLWRFTDFGIPSIPARGSVLIVADNDDRPPFKTFYRPEDVEERRNPIPSTHFSLSGDSEDGFAILDGRGVIVDSLIVDFSIVEAPQDVSFGRFPDGFMPGTPLTQQNLDLVSPTSNEDRKVHTKFLIPTPGAPNAPDRDIAPSFDPIVWIRRNAVSSFARECPQPADSPETFVYLNLDRDTFSANTPETPSFDVALFLKLGDAAEQRIPRASREFPNGLIVRLVSECTRECFEPEPVPGALTLEIRYRVPAQPAGTLVQMRFEADDLLQGTRAVLVESPERPETLLHYRVAQEKPPLVLNEALPDPQSVLADLYPASVRDDPAFRPPEYIELFNLGETALDLGGLFLAQEPGRVCESDGLPCQPGSIRGLFEVAIPAGAVIGANDAFVVLLARDEDLNAQPELAGTPLEGRTAIIANVFRLDNCRETIYLMGDERFDFCQIDVLSWDFRTPDERSSGAECATSYPDRAVGRIPDGSGAVQDLPLASPGAPNAGCLYAPPALDGAVSRTVLGPAHEGGCVAADNAVQVNWQATIDLAEYLAHEAEKGLQAAEVVIVRDGAADAARPIQDFPHLIARQMTPTDPECRAVLSFQVEVPAPAEGSSSTVEYRFRIDDTRGGSLELAPLEFPVCALLELPFLRGDANGDGRINISDVTALNRVVFGLDPAPSCPDRFDADDDGDVDADDVRRLTEYLNRQVPALPAPFPDPGADPTADDLRCR